MFFWISALSWNINILPHSFWALQCWWHLVLSRQQVTAQSFCVKPKTSQFLLFLLQGSNVGSKAKILRSLSVKSTNSKTEITRICGNRILIIVKLIKVFFVTYLEQFSLKTLSVLNSSFNRNDSARVKEFCQIWVLPDLLEVSFPAPSLVMAVWAAEPRHPQRAARDGTCISTFGTG